MPDPLNWGGEVGFIIGGGPSLVTQPLELLRRRRVLVINSSYERVSNEWWPRPDSCLLPSIPEADALFFGDMRWYLVHREKIEWFPGRVVTVHGGFGRLNYPKRFAQYRQAPTNGLSKDKETLSIKRTSLTGAIDLLAKSGVRGIVLLGIDGKPGRHSLHHHSPHQWSMKPDCWQGQHDELATLVAPLRERNIKVINASPGSAWADLWPIMSLRDAIEEIQAR